MLESLTELALSGFRLYPWGGVEVGGILYGTNEPDGIQLHAWRPFECEHEYGPAFELTAGDFGRFERLLASAGQEQTLSGLVPVGWYHSVSNRELILSDYDRELHGRFFPQPWQIAMILKRSKRHPLVVGFFHADAIGSLKPHSSQQKFAIADLRLAQPQLAPSTPTPSEPTPESLESQAPKDSVFEPQIEAVEMAVAAEPVVVAETAIEDEPTGAMETPIAPVEPSPTPPQLEPSAIAIPPLLPNRFDAFLERKIRSRRCRT